MKLILFIILLTLFAIKAIAHGTIIIGEVEHNNGYIDVKIYADKETFLKEELAVESIRKKATKGQTIVPLSKIHEGIFAVVAYHDEDNDGKLKTGFFWRPKEGFAFSNKYTPKGPPKFSKATIDLIHGELVYIDLEYWLINIQTPI